MGPSSPLDVRPLVPDAHTVFLQPSHVRLSAQEPEQLVDNGPKVKELRSDGGKAPLEVESQLTTEHTASAGAGAVLPIHPAIPHFPQ